jgi:hypothetical protein
MTRKTTFTTRPIFRLCILPQGFNITCPSYETRLSLFHDVLGIEETIAWARQLVPGSAAETTLVLDTTHLDAVAHMLTIQLGNMKRDIRKLRILQAREAALRRYDRNGPRALLPAKGEVAV